MNPAPRHAVSGSATLFALLVIIVGAVVLAGWAAVLATRVTFAETSAQGVQRRIAAENGRALLREAVRTAIPAGTISNANATLSGGWGGFSVVAASGWLQGDTPPATINRFSPLQELGFGQPLTATVNDGSGNTSWTVFVRSGSPVYSGLPTTVQNPTTTLPSTLGINGTSLVWPTSGFLGFATTRYLAPGARSSLNASGGALSGFPWTPITSGLVAGQGSYAGFFAPTPRTFTGVSDDPSVSTDGIQITDAGAQRTVRLDLELVNLLTFNGTAPPDLRLHFSVPSASAPGITSIRLQLVGSGNATLPPLHVIYNAGTVDLTTIELSGANDRPVYLSVNKTTSVTLTTGAALNFRLGASLIGAPLVVQAGGVLTLRGGIRTNANVTVNTGSISILPDATPGGLSAIGDRIYWMEDFATP